MGIRINRGVAVAAGVICASVGGVTVASAAATPSPTASATPSSGTALRPLRAPRLAGEVVSDSATGGSLGAGQLVLTKPDGTRVTLNLANRTKAWKYQGFGVKPTAESPSAIAAGEIVVAGVRKYKGNPVAVRILDLGFQAATLPSSSRVTLSPHLPGAGGPVRRLTCLREPAVSDVVVAVGQRPRRLGSYIDGGGPD